MNPDAWESLPEDVQDIFEESGMGLELSHQCAEVYREAEQRGYDIMEQEGIEMHEWTEAEREELREAAEPVIQNYIDQLEDQGYDAQNVYEDMIEIRDELRN